MECDYKSKYTDRKVTPAQYLAELICERIAWKDKKTLQWKFWNTPEWRNIFRKQVVDANKLLKDYSLKAIIAALKDFRSKKVYSLGAKHILIPLIEREEARIKEEIESFNTELPKVDIFEKPQKPKKKGSLDKLAELDELLDI